MPDEQFLSPEEAESAFEAGQDVRLDLHVPCITVENGLLCGMTEAYINVKPFGTSFHYERRCANRHFIDNVKHAEVELYFGLKKDSAPTRSRSREVLDPPRRVKFNVGLRDQFRCVYCGRRSGELDLAGKVIQIHADHIIPKRLIDPEDIKRDRELLRLAREIQLVTACDEDNRSKADTLLPLDSAREIFVRVVLQGKTGGTNLGLVARFESLYRVVALNLRIRKRRAT